LPDWRVNARATSSQHDASASDDALVAAIRGGDVAAFEALFVRYHQRLVQFGVHVTGSAIIADEVVVDVFMVIWDTRARWTVRPGHVAEYLYVAVRNRARNVARTDQRRARLRDTFTHGDDVPGMAHDTLDILERLYAEDVARALESAIARLPERSRAAITLRWQQQMPIAEIASALGTTPGGAQMLLGRGLKALRTLLERFPL